ncbi:hypothetical protein, partial [Bacteriovorax sp. DB6_IX]|uniref:hypothetical protein n=1 Tax=Bacteriovorax sp. DB6_IX TaxID=1353530 RepID=UPI000389E025
LYTAISEIEKASANQAPLAYQNQMKEIKEKLEKQFITPLTKVYKKQFKTNNMRIIDKDVTDWNHLVYPDALFSQKIYEYLENFNL